MLEFSRNGEKREWEKIVLYYYSPFWVGLMAIVVVFRLYDSFDALNYVVLGVIISLSSVLFPLMMIKREINWERHWVKSNIWIAIVSYIGNHFLTHYFYQVLGCRYTVPIENGKWAINDVPICMYLITHGYFMTYHVFSSCILRKLSFSLSSHKIAILFFGIVLAFLTAFMETFSISSFPHYRYPSLVVMLSYGSMFYTLFLSVTFLMYFRFEEPERVISSSSSPSSSLFQTITESLASCMMVFVLYDIWRLWIGDVGHAVEVPSHLECSGCAGSVPY